MLVRSRRCLYKKWTECQTCQSSAPIFALHTKLYGTFQCPHVSVFFPVYVIKLTVKWMTADFWLTVNNQWCKQFFCFPSIYVNDFHSKLFWRKSKMELVPVTYDKEEYIETVIQFVKNKFKFRTNFFLLVRLTEFTFDGIFRHLGTKWAERLFCAVLKILFWMEKSLFKLVPSYAVTYQMYERAGIVWSARKQSFDQLTSNSVLGKCFSVHQTIPMSTVKLSYQYRKFDNLGVPIQLFE